jgi:predicted transcriptional regulator
MNFFEKVSTRKFLYSSLNIEFLSGTNMELLEITQDVCDEKNKDSLVYILSDKYCRQILQATLYKPKSAMELGRECGIPISTVYRRLQNLHDNHLMQTTGNISEDGKKYFLYKSKVDGISAVFTKNGFKVNIQWK